MAYQINNWDEHFESADAKRRKGPLKWVRVTTQHDGKRFRRLMRHDNGAAIFAAWMLIVQVAAKCPTRGVLIDSAGQALDADDLEDITGLPARHFRMALDVLSSYRIGWIRNTDPPATDAQQKAQKAHQIGPVLQHPATDESATERDESAADRCESDAVYGKSEADTDPPATDAQQKAQKAHSRLDEDEDEELEEELDEERAGGYQPRSRSGARQLWLVHCSKLGPGVGSSQWRSDKTSAERMFDELIWPEDLDAVEGTERFAQAEGVAKRAASIKPKPMAWLTTTLKAEMGAGVSQ